MAAAAGTDGAGVRDDPLGLEREFHQARRTWRVQRIAWAAMTLVLVAGGLGVFGRGVLSRARAEAAGGAASVEYERFVRNNAPTEMRLTLRPALGRGEVAVRLESEYLARARPRRITPEPAAQRAGDGWVEYVFAASGAEVEVCVTLDVAHVGRMGTAVTVGGAAARIEQFSYP